MTIFGAITMPVLTPHQQSVLASMPSGQWVRAEGSTTYALLERLGLVEMTSRREAHQYGKSPAMVVCVRYYRKFD